jgi:hypothetical protein
LHCLKGEDFYPPLAGQRAWDWFWELDKGRQIGMELNAITWSDILAWQCITGVEPELWELNAIYRMGIYRINPDYKPFVPKPAEPVSMVKQFQAIQEAYKKRGRK